MFCGCCSGFNAGCPEQHPPKSAWDTGKHQEVKLLTCKTDQTASFLQLGIQELEATFCTSGGLLFDHFWQSYVLGTNGHVEIVSIEILGIGPFSGASAEDVYVPYTSPLVMSAEAQLVWLMCFTQKAFVFDKRTTWGPTPISYRPFVCFIRNIPGCLGFCSSCTCLLLVGVLVDIHCFIVVYNYIMVYIYIYMCIIVFFERAARTSTLNLQWNFWVSPIGCMLKHNAEVGETWSFELAFLGPTEVYWLGTWLAKSS